MLSGIQAKLVYQEFKLLLQNVWINHHKFIPADPVGALRENCISIMSRPAPLRQRLSELPAGRSHPEHDG